MTAEETPLGLDDLIADADEARGLGELDAALALYRRALMVSTDDDVLERASIYASVGATKLEQKKNLEAESNFEKALALMPGYRPALVALVDMATAEGDWRRVVSYRQKLADLAHEDDDRVKELLEIATVLSDKRDDARAAITVLEKIREISPGEQRALDRLLALYQKLNRWPKIVEILGAQCTELDDPVARGALRFQQADIVLGRLRDEPRGVGMLEAALEEDPAHEKALLALVAVRTRLAEWTELERVYARLIDRHAERGDLERAWDVCKRLAVLRRDKLGDGPGAVEAFTGAVRLKPRDADTRAALAELLIARGDSDLALEELEQAAAASPTRAQTFRRLFEIHTKNGQTDRAYLAALALEILTAAEMDHELLIEQFRPDGTLKPTAALTDFDWDACLRAPGHDPDVARILRAIGPAAVRARVNELTDQKRLVSLDLTKRQEPTSTITAVRAFAWASNVLGIALPEMYIMDNVPGGVAAVQAWSPTTAIGPEVLSNVGLTEVVYVAARHLAYYRPEHYPLVFFPTLAELTQLFLAALKLGMPEVPMPPNEGVAKLRRQLAQSLEAAEKGELESAAKAIEDKGGKVDLAAYIRGVELTAHRAAFVLSADAHVATRRIASEQRAIAEVTADDRRHDLLAYLASHGLAEARQKLTSKPSLRPSAPAPAQSAPPKAS